MKDKNYYQVKLNQQEKEKLELAKALKGFATNKDLLLWAIKKIKQEFPGAFID